MTNVNNEEIPQEAIQALKMVEASLGRSIVRVYLFGSAVKGGLRMNSDVDVLVVVNHRLPEITRRKLTDRLMLISGKIGNTESKKMWYLGDIRQKMNSPMGSGSGRRLRKGKSKNQRMTLIWLSF